MPATFSLLWNSERDKIRYLKKKISATKELRDNTQ